MKNTARMKNSPREGKYSHSAIEINQIKEIIEIKEIHIFSTQEQILHQEWGTFIIHTDDLLLSLINMELHDSCPFWASLKKQPSAFPPMNCSSYGITALKSYVEAVK